MKKHTISSVIAALTMLGASVALAVLMQTNAPKLVSPGSRMVMASNSGEHIPSFFVGLPPIPAYLNGKLYSAGRKPQGCDRKPNLLERAAIRLGLERVAYAQFGCDAGSCNGCYIYITEAMCTGACEGMNYTATGGNSSCYAGENLDGPACGVDNGCGCNQTNCYNAPCCQ